MKIKTLYKPLFLICFTVLTACDRGGDGVPEGNSDFVDTYDPDKFLQFINPQNSLPASTGYQLKVGTATAGESGSYTAEIVLTDGTIHNCSGNWTNSGGPDASSVNNPACDFGSGVTIFSVPVSGGADITITSDIDTCIYLLDRDDNPIIDTATTGCEFTSTMSLPESRINFDDHGAAYYNVVDPDNTRTTLNDWAAANGFDFDNDNPNYNCSQATLDKFGQCGVHVQFRDTKDLGYGRDMYARRDDRCLGALDDPTASCAPNQIVLTHFAVYVKNFQVDAIPGLQYSALNYQSMIEGDLQWHFGSNAIEFSTYPYGDGDPSDGSTNDDGMDTKFTKFYTFLADKTDFSAAETRLNSVNLDSRGYRSMPGPCISCHGGKTRPLLPDGTLAPPYPGGLKGDTQAKIQAIEINSIGFPNPGDPIPTEQQAGLKFINQAIRDSYLILCQQNDDGDDDGIPDNDGDCVDNPDNVATGGKWNPTQPLEWLSGSYGGLDSNGVFIANEYNETYVPSGWQPNLSAGSPPAGADTLFLEVIKPNCLVCHNKRSNDNQKPDDTDINNASNGAINFGSYESFITHATQIERFVYDKGLMPLGILNFDQFWDNVSPNKASLLGSYLPGFSHGNADGTTQEPGRAIAQIAAPGKTRLAPITISGAGSPFSDSYQWSIALKPVGAGTALLSNTTSERATFTPNVEGSYNIKLVTSNSLGESAPAIFTIIVDDSLTVNGADLRPAPADIRFDPDIKNVLQGTNGQNLGGTTCQNCHSAQGTNVLSVRDIPLFYTDTQVEGRDLYLEVIQRTNFSDPLESWLLRRPSGRQHPGGCLGGFDIYPGDETDSEHENATDAIPDCDGTDDDRRNYDLFLTWILEGAMR